MSAARILSVNSHLVASEILDTEAVIINLSNGAYYTLDDVGAEVWRMIEQGRSLQFMSSALAGRYSVSPAEALRDVEEITRELLEEELVIVEEGSSEADQEAAPMDRPHTQAPYSKPKLVKYSDMSEVLALDPPLPWLGALGGNLKTG